MVGPYDGRVTAQPSSARSPLRQRLGAMVWALALTLVGLVIAAPQARADDANEVDITLTMVSPQVAPTEPEGRITITGEVKNTSKRPMTGVQVSFWRSRDPISTSSDLDSAADSPWDVPFGERMGVQGTEPEQNLANITSDADPTFEPGETASFTVSARRDQLDLGQPEGVRLLGVHVRGTPEGERNYTVGRARVFVPMVAPQPVKRSQIVMLTSHPSMIAPGLFSDTHLVGELRGRLGTLIREAARPETTVLVDPSLIDEITAMTAEDGYQLASGETTTVGRELALEFLSRFETIRTSGTLYRLPYGNPDLALAHQEGRGEVITRTAAALPPKHALARLPLAVVPDRAVDLSFRRWVEPLRPKLLVLRRTPGPAKQNLDGLLVVRTDATLGEGGPGPDPSNTAPQRVGRTLSEMLLSGQTELVTLSEQYRPDVERTVRQLSTLTPLAEVPTTAGQVSWPKPVNGSVVDRGWWARMSYANTRLTEAADLRGQLQAGRVEAAAITSRAAASGFHGSQRVRFLNMALQHAPDVSQQNVRIDSADTFVVNAPRTDLPITVTNNTDSPVAVKVVFISENDQRIFLPDTTMHTIPPRSSRSFTFRVEARTNGAVTVRAGLRTSTEVAVGGEHRFTVTATSLGRIGWVIIVASGAVVVGATGLRIRQVRSERAKAAARAARPSSDDGTFRTADDLGTRPHP